jgi:ADP-ribose 1''-phosphate phosphatase
MFDAPPGSALIQACNCQGSWGSGVAAAFRANFPVGYKDYSNHCRKHLPTDFRKRSSLVGTSFSSWDHMKTKEKEPMFLLISLFTSNHFASRVDSPEAIVKATDSALAQLVQDPNLKTITEIHSPKMNSGLFNVPWEMTQEVIEKYLPSLNKKFIVWEL